MAELGIDEETLEMKWNVESHYMSVAALLFLILAASAISHSHLDVGDIVCHPRTPSFPMHQHPSRCLILQAQTKSEKGVLPPATNIICISISCVESHRSVQKPNYAELVCLQNCKISFYNPLSSRGRQLPRVWAKMGSLHRWPD